MFVRRKCAIYQVERDDMHDLRYADILLKANIMLMNENKSEYVRYWLFYTTNSKPGSLFNFCLKRVVARYAVHQHCTAGIHFICNNVRSLFSQAKQARNTFLANCSYFYSTLLHGLLQVIRCNYVVIVLLLI